MTARKSRARTPTVANPENPQSKDHDMSTPATETAPVVPTATSVADTVFTKADVEAAIEKGRKESNDRLYGQLESTKSQSKAMEDELARLRAAEEQRKADDKKRTDDAAAAAQAAREADMDAKQLIEERDRQHAEEMAQFRAEQETLRQEIATRDALIAREAQRRDIQDYIRERVLAEGDDIIPDLADFVSGETKEQVETSIANVKARSASILEGIRRAQTAQRAATPGASVSAGNVGPGDAINGGQPQELSPEDIMALPFDDPRYMALRRQYGMDKQTQGRNMGAFGTGSFT